MEKKEKKIEMSFGMYKSMVRTMVSTHNGKEIPISPVETIPPIAVLVTEGSRVGAYVYRDDRLVNVCDLSLIKFWGPMMINRCFNLQIYTLFDLFKVASQAPNPMRFIRDIMRNEHAGQTIKGGVKVAEINSKAEEHFLAFLRDATISDSRTVVGTDAGKLYKKLFDSQEFVTVKAAFQLG